jgi:hypothetical protein
VVLLVGVATKYDILVFPLLVFLAYRKTDSLKTNLFRSIALATLTVSAFLLLRGLIPGGFEPRPVGSLTAANLSVIREMLIYYPPFLALSFPAVLAAVGYSSANQFARSCVQLMILVALILFVQTNFVEFRAEVPLLILLFPCAWFGLQRLAGIRATASVASQP